MKVDFPDSNPVTRAERAGGSCGGDLPADVFCRTAHFLLYHTTTTYYYYVYPNNIGCDTNTHGVCLTLKMLPLRLPNCYRKRIGDERMKVDRSQQSD